MKRFMSPRAVLIVLVLAVFSAVALTAQRTPPAAAAMTTAATRFLDALDAEQRKKATYPLESEEYLRWNFIPTEAFPRNGLLLREMTEPQRKLAHDLLRSGLSDRGYQTYSAIIALEDILRVVEGRGSAAPGAAPGGAPGGAQPGAARGGGGGRGGFERDPTKYFFTVFGQPSATGNWGWRVEGHHISLHFAVSKGQVIASTPSFAGSNPAEVRDGAEKGKRVLANLEDTGRALVMALDEKQRATAIINATAPNEIVTNNTLDIKPLSPDGLKVSAMTPAQRDLLMKVIDAYAGLMTPDVAAQRMAKIKSAGIENVGFAWAGPVERGALHYYRVQGPSFLIEFDNTQNQGNHVHSIWRDFNGDFGRDLLREHIKTAHLTGTVPAL
ncbi:MAG TPA: DUF3500 domain-containing protein [Vicinamibacterales bacterium]|nr:DUF3500 domain-containing protein [Vicinamibacterales bacterium]